MGYYITKYLTCDMRSLGPILKPTGNYFPTILADIDRKKFDFAFNHIFYENHQ